MCFLSFLLFIGAKKPLEISWQNKIIVAFLANFCCFCSFVQFICANIAQVIIVLFVALFVSLKSFKLFESLSFFVEKAFVCLLIEKKRKEEVKKKRKCNKLNAISCFLPPQVLATKT